MIELGLVFVINGAGLAFSGLLARWVSLRDPGGSDLRRVQSAVRRALESTLWSQYRLAALGVAALGAVGFALHVLLAHGGRVGGFEAAFWSSLGLGLGAVSACLVAHVAARLGLSAALRAAAAARAGTDRALAVAVRAGGASGLFVECISVIGVASLLAVPLLLRGGASLPPDEAADLALRLASLLPAYGVGVAMVALVVQRGGTVYRCGGRIGPKLAVEARRAFEEQDPRNPAIVANLVGAHLGLSASRAVDLLLSSTVANIAAALVGITVYRDSLGYPGNAFALPGLALAIRAFGVIACAIGVMVVDSRQAPPSAAALWRGQATTATVALGGLVGACIWLVGDHWSWLVAAGSAGLVACSATAHAVRLVLYRRFGPLRDVVEALRSGSPSVLVQAAGVGLQATALPVAVLGLGLAAAWQLGEATELPGGGRLALTTALMTILASGPYLLAVSTLHPVATTAQSMAVMASSPQPVERQRAAARLHEAAHHATTVGHTYLTLSSAIAAAVAATTLPLIRGGQSPGVDPLGIDLAHPTVLWCGALGAVAVLFYAGQLMRACVRGARGVAAEIERQLGGFQRDHQGIPQVPRDHIPSYRACIDVASRASLARLLPSTAPYLLIPAALGAALALAYGPGDPATVRQARASFVAIAAIAGLAAALAVDGSRGVLAAARRGDRPRTGQPGSDALVATEALAGALGESAGPSAHLLAKVAAVSALFVSTFLG